MRSLTFIDLFAGIGGFRYALEEFGLDCVFSSEWDKHAQVTYKANFGDNPHGDITKITLDDIPDHDVLCGGFPCQAFSVSGKRKGFEDTRGTLFFDVARIAKYHQPKVLFLENVKNFAVHDNGKTLATVINTLDEIGYNSFYKVLNASNFGVPTARQRIYIVAFRKDLNITNFDFPKKAGNQISLLDILEKDNQETKACEIIRDDIYLKPVIVEKDIFGNYPQKPIRVGTINGGGQGERIYSPLGHSITLSAHGGGAAAKTGAYLINGKIRKLTPRECARVMGFPESFKIPVTKTQAYKQFGNSVAIPVLKAIFKEVLNKLENNQNNQNIWQIEENTQQISVHRLQDMVL
jgi:DNA (cytosine-5)-methyltransferase 1